MDDAPIITCVIATYKRPKLLRRAICSALNQTFKQIVVFVTDNASGDETAEVVKTIQAKDPRLIYHCQPENLGMFANWTYGLSQVRTPFYSILNDDDVLLPEFYERAYAEFLKHSEAIMVATKVPQVTDRGEFISEPLSRWDRTGVFMPPEGAIRVAAKGHPEIIGILFREKLLRTPYGFPLPGIHGADYEIIFKTCLHFPIVTLDYDGALFVQHRGTRAAVQNLFSEIENYFNWIHVVDEDNRFSPDTKADNRRKWLPVIARLVVRYTLCGDQRGVKKALEMCKTIYGDSALFAMLVVLNWFCHTFPPMKPFLTFLLYNIAKRIRDLSKHYPLVKKYQESLTM